jgi:hypothetical protein
MLAEIVPKIAPILNEKLWLQLIIGDIRARSRGIRKAF